MSMEVHDIYILSLFSKYLVDVSVLRSRISFQGTAKIQVCLAYPLYINVVSEYHILHVHLRSGQDIRICRDDGVRCFWDCVHPWNPGC